MGDQQTDPARESAPDAVSGAEVTAFVGERVRELRRGLDLTLERFAERADISIGMLSKIENGQTSPSLATLAALAGAAGVPLTSLFRGLDEERDALLVRAGQGIPIDHEGASDGRVYEDLGSLRGPRREIEPVLVTIEDEGEVFPLFQHPGVEFLHVLEGRFEYGYGAKRYELAAGDTLQFQGEVPHGPTRLIEVPVRFLSLKVQQPG